MQRDEAVDADEIGRAAGVLRAGGLVAFPTETVYGLGADAKSPSALRRLYEVKGRPASHPVIVHLGDPAQLDAWGVDVNDAARTLVASFWPGPLTVVVRRAGHVPDAVTGGLDTVGLRVPDEPVARALLRAFGGGVAAPSANRFGRVSPTTAADVVDDLGDDVDVILDGGPCRVGVESTIVDCSGDDPTILRVGATPREALAAVLGRALPLLDSGEVRAPGTLASHYAPRARVSFTGLESVSDLLGAARARHARIGVIGAVGDGDDVTELGMPRDGDEYAHDLYRMLRAADDRGLDEVVAVMPDPAGLGAAVADRLRRAAGPR